jgi:DNA repair protein RecO (recombination protein O)
VFLHKSSEALDLLTEAKLERRFRAARKDLSHLYAGYYVAELLDALTDADDPHPELFEAAEQTLRDLDGQAELAPLVLRFELTALRVLGHLPSLVDCAGCGTPVSTVGRVAFGQLAGGVLCAPCRVGQRQVVSVSGPVVDALRTFARPDDAWRQAGLDPRLRGELRGVLNNYLANLMGRKPKLHAYLGVLGN